jgi:hypothetical protein
MAHTVTMAIVFAMAGVGAYVVYGKEHPESGRLAPRARYSKEWVGLASGEPVRPGAREGKDLGMLRARQPRASGPPV